MGTALFVYLPWVFREVHHSGHEERVVNVLSGYDLVKMVIMI